MKNSQNTKALCRAAQPTAAIRKNVAKRKWLKVIEFAKKISIQKKWLKVVEFAIMGFAFWLNPSAGFQILLLGLCFQILYALQKDDQK